MRERRLRRLRDYWWVAASPLILTLLFSQVEEHASWSALASVLVTNLTFTLGMGLTAQFLYGRVFALIQRLGTKDVRAWLLHAGVILTSVVGGGEIALRVASLYPWIGPIDGKARLSVYRVGFVIVIVVAAIQITYARLRAHARAVELREESSRREALRAQLSALQARTNPHFLYNSLNTVASLIEENPRLAEEMLERLSQLFRYALEGSRALRVPLGRELAAVQDYLEIESLRFGDRLRFAIETDPSLAECAVPPLVLQPLVENAVLHGVSRRREGGRVDVRAERDADAIALSVEDDGPGLGGSNHSGSQTSLEELRERLRLLYGDAASLDAGTRGPTGGCRVRVRLPLSDGATP